MESQDKNDEVAVTKETMLRQDAELCLKEFQSESTYCKNHLIRLQQDLQRMEDMMKRMLQFKSQLDQLRHEKTSIALKYENKLRKYQAYMATLERGNLLLLSKTQKIRENDKEKYEEEKEISFSRVLLERIQLLEQENSSLHLENEEQRLQYERCIDDVANQVVQALLGQKNLREECGKLEERMRNLEQQNSVLAARLLQVDFQSQLSTLDIINQDPEDFLLHSSKAKRQNSLWDSHFPTSTPYNNHQLIRSTHNEQLLNNSDNDYDTEEEEVINTVRWGDSTIRIGKSHSDVHLGKRGKAEDINVSEFNELDKVWKIQQEEQKANQHSKEHVNTISKPTFEKELLSIDNLSPLISPNKLIVPNHRTIQDIVANFSMPENEPNEVIFNSSQLRSNILPNSETRISDDLPYYFRVGNAVSEIGENLQPESVRTLYPNADYEFKMFCTKEENNSPSIFIDHPKYNKHSCFPWEMSRESTALESASVSKLVESTSNRRTNTVIRKGQSNDKADFDNFSLLVSDTEFSGLLHSAESLKSSVEPDHSSKDEGYSTMSSDIQVDATESEKSDTQNTKLILNNTSLIYEKSISSGVSDKHPKTSLEKERGEMISSSDSGLGLNLCLQTKFLDPSSSMSQLKGARERNNFFLSSTQDQGRIQHVHSISSLDIERSSEINNNSEKNTDRRKSETDKDDKDVGINLSFNCFSGSTLYAPQKLDFDNICSENKYKSITNNFVHNNNVQLEPHKSDRSEETKRIVMPKIEKLSKLERVISKKPVFSYPFQLTYHPQVLKTQNRFFPISVVHHASLRRAVSDSVLSASQLKNSCSCVGKVEKSRLNFHPLERRASLSEFHFPTSINTDNKNKTEDGKNNVASFIQHVQTYERLEGSPSCSDSLSSVHSSSSEVTNSEEFEDLKPTSLKCSRDNDLWSASEDEADFPEHHTFVQQWLKMEGEQLTEDCQETHSVDERKNKVWKFQHTTVDNKQATRDSEENVVEKVISSNSLSQYILESIEEEKESEEELHKAILCSVELQHKKTVPGKTTGVTEWISSENNRHQIDNMDVVLENSDNEPAIVSGGVSYSCSKDIDWKRATTKTLNSTTVLTSYSYDTEDGYLDEMPESNSKNYISSLRGVLFSDKNILQAENSGEIGEDSAPRTLQDDYSLSKSDVCNHPSSVCLDIATNKPENQLNLKSKCQSILGEASLQTKFNPVVNGLKNEVKKECHKFLNRTQAEALDASMRSEHSNELFSSKKPTLSTLSDSHFAHSKQENDTSQQSQDKENSARPNCKRTPPVIQNIVTREKAKPTILPKPSQLKPTTSRIPVLGISDNGQSKAERTKIPIFTNSFINVHKEGNKELSNIKQKQPTNKNKNVPKVRLKYPELYKKSSKVSDEKTLKQPQKPETSHSLSPRSRDLVKHKNINSDKISVRCTAEVKGHALASQRNINMDVEQLSFESNGLSVAEKIQILNSLLDKNEFSPLPCCHESNSAELFRISSVTDPAAVKTIKEGCRSSWIHVSPEANVHHFQKISELLESTAGSSNSSEESEEDMQENQSSHQKNVQQGVNSGAFLKLPRKEKLSEKSFEDEETASFANRRGEKKVLPQSVKSDLFPIVTNSTIFPKNMDMTESCMTVLSQGEDNSEHVCFSDSCAESFCSSTRSLNS
ncbi:uncharacterized protein LOC111087285 [Limulus polyphemus]|uniref:Uncharacterized protein LOC111087285 n=1 Tax=Limulus polyphemus TaxID=6850 RepID=A0ABM1SZR4_LIMPO|nr:uncharacterized protein LOC111087285 [Limulus polyphemus]